MIVIIWIVGVIWALALIIKGEYTNGFMVFLLASALGKAHNAEVEAEYAKAYAKTSAENAQEIYKKLDKLARRLVKWES